jgi:hypothetical protein
MVFVSHANPEENEFARWLTLQLANEGYPVWCDQTKLLGGEKFWEDIEGAIKKRTVKFLFVLSRAANEKRGTLDELDCAIGVEKKHSEIPDFIIPLKIDDLPHDDVYISIRRLNQIDFRSSWASGLGKLLEKLAIDQVPKSPSFNPDAVATWWRSQTDFSAEQGMVAKPDVHFSNWFPITGLPESLLRHSVTRKGIGKIEFDAGGFSHPAVNDTDLSFLSFAKAEHFENLLPLDHFIEGTSEISLQSIRERTAPRGYPALLTQLLRVAWERMMEKTLLQIYEMSSRAKCFYFRQNAVKDDRLFFEGVDGKRAYRDVIGYATKLGSKRYWHYGINAKPALNPEIQFVVKGHVIFSSDGAKIWDSKDKLAKARRNQCKNWWNDEWRDRMLAVMTRAVYSIRTNFPPKHDQVHLRHHLPPFNLKRSSSRTQHVPTLPPTSHFWVPKKAERDSGMMPKRFSTSTLSAFYRHVTDRRCEADL